MTDKWGRRLFKIGAALLLLMGLVHSLSLFSKPVPANETERQLLDLMTNYRFNMMGSVRTMFDMLQGFSIAFMLAAIALGALDLLLIRERTSLLKRVALVNIIWLAAMTGVSVRYFFVGPTTLLGIALMIFLVAWWKLPARGSDALHHPR